MKARVLAILGSAALLLPGGAEAHLVSTGVGPFYDGAAHFFVSMEELLPVLALALLAGARGKGSGRAAVSLLPLVWLASGLAGLRFPMEAPAPLATTFLFVVPGALLAWDPELPRAAVAAVTFGTGLAAGFVNGSAMAAASEEPALALVGGVVSAFVFASVFAALAVSHRSGWTRIAIRVAGSWIAAVGLLALGWALRGAV